MAISKSYTEKMSGQSTLFAEDSPARIFRPQEKCEGLTATDPDSGKNTPALLASWSHDTRLWKTSQLSLFGGLSEFSGTWPRSGILRNGIAFQLDPLVRLTDETGSGYWPTPMAHEGGTGPVSLTGAISGKFHMTLDRAVELDRLHDDSNPVAMTFETYRNDGGKLNPNWIEWLMGYPTGWTEIEDWGTPLFRR